MKKIIYLTVTAYISTFSFEAIAAWYHQSTGSCGNGCTYTIDGENNLTITGSGNNATINSNFFSGGTTYSPELDNDGAIHTVNNVTIEGIKTIGSEAINHLHIAGDLKVSGMTTLPYTAFTWSKVDGNMYIDDNISNINTSAFWGMRFNGNVVLPENASLGNTVFRSAYMDGIVKITPTQCNTNLFAYYSRFGSNATVYIDGNEAAVNTCKNKISQTYEKGDTGGLQSILSKIRACENNNCDTAVCGAGHTLNNFGACLISCPDNCTTCDSEGKCTRCSDSFLKKGSECISAAACINGFHATDEGDCEANSDSNCNTEVNGKCTVCKNSTLEQDGSCVSSCSSGYKNMGGFCNRIQYTPAEAAAILNDNNNTITITFKK